jgi:hypothetical protein
MLHTPEDDRSRRSKLLSRERHGRVGAGACFDVLRRAHRNVELDLIAKIAVGRS